MRLGADQTSHSREEWKLVLFWRFVLNCSYISINSFYEHNLYFTRILCRTRIRNSDRIYRSENNSFNLTAFAFFVIPNVRNSDTNSVYADQEGGFKIFCSDGKLYFISNKKLAAYFVGIYSLNWTELVHVVFMGYLCIDNSRNCDSAPPEYKSLEFPSRIDHGQFMWSWSWPWWKRNFKDSK